MPVFEASPVNVINAEAVSSGSWTTVTSSDHLTGSSDDIAGVFLRMAGLGTVGDSVTAGVRKNGSGDSINNGVGWSAGVFHIGTDTAGLFQVYTNNTQTQLFLEGWYTDTEATFNTNSVDLIGQYAGNSGTYADISISSLTGSTTALVAFVDHQSTDFSFADAALRVNGTTDTDRQPRARIRNTHKPYAIGLDGSEIFELIDDADSERLLWLHGWLYDNASVIANGVTIADSGTTNWGSGTATWVTLDLTGTANSSAAGIMYEFASQVGQSFDRGARPLGQTYEAFAGTIHEAFDRNVVALNSSLELEATVSDSRYWMNYYGSLFAADTSGAAPAPAPVRRHFTLLGVGR